MRDFILKSGVYRPITTLLLCLALIIATSWGAGLLVFKSDNRVFFAPDNPQLQAFDQMEAVYAKSDNVAFLVVPKNGDIFTRENLTAIQQLTKSAWQTPYSSRVDSISNYQHTYATDDELVVGDLVLNPQALDATQLEQLRAIALNEPLLVKRLISTQGHVSLINVTLQKPGLDAEKELAEISQFARQLRDDLMASYPQIDIYLTGLVMMDVAFAEAALADNETLVPLMFLVVFLAVGLLLKTITGTLATVFIAVVSIAVTLGAAGWLGIALTPPSAAAPIMILTIVVADCVHILAGLFQEMRQGVERRQALYNSLQHNVKAIFLTSVTTALGFLSMNFSDVPPFQDLGNMVAFGVMTAFLLSVTLFPALLSILPITPFKQGVRQNSRLMSAISQFVVTHYRRLLPGSVLVMAAMLLFIPQNELNDKYVEFFDQSVPFRAATELMEQQLSGVDTLEFSIETATPNGINKPEVIAAIEQFSNWLRSLPEVDHVNTLSDTFKRLNKNMHGDDPAWYKLPDNPQLAAQYLLLYEMSLPIGLDLNNQINVDKSATRLIVTLKNLPTYQLLEFEQRASSWFAGQYPELQLKAASISLMFAHVSKKNIDSMLLGSIVALILISPILGFAMRSTKYGFISLLPNLLPAGIAFGIWGLLSGEVGLGLSVVIGTTLGIVVDDTVHFISKYLYARRERKMAPNAAIHYTFQTVGPALWFTSLILIAGFAIMALSTYRVNAEMGLMTAITIAIALIVDFLFLPSLLMATDKADAVTQPVDENANLSEKIEEQSVC
ncbi:MAG: MMPL family transporter [Gammaproteobacteria bacterium]|nr:MMPL family transporter [Gammaproteobacteria bacterium]MBU1554950.1 MMPL family transporter [Gammaproteobacteria bacterium]MBU2071002.1 MMPL family transporter [Gammaproteobacteria bacterium]MBU2183828.1 MMPL family transporter [Gammaproteobacteria bacterium]MBU2206473.1 MMPL family transporter [Gammaproteobacteria bacterium]